MARSLINAAKQVKAESVELGLLSLAIQNEIAQIDVNKTDIAAIIASKGAANGIATLDAAGKVLTSQLPALAISNTSVVADEAGMLALTAQTGDVAVRTDESKSYILRGTDPSVLADWEELLSPTTGVTSINGNTGAITLADVAFSGASADVAFAHASYTATDVSGALVEVMAKANTVEGDYQAADTVLQSNIDTVETNYLAADAALQTAIDGKLEAASLKKYVVPTGAIDGTNKDYTLPEDFVTGTLQVSWNGQELLPGDDFSTAGNVISFVGSPDPGDKVWAHYVAA